MCQGCPVLPMAPASPRSYTSRRTLRNEGPTWLLNTTPGLIEGIELAAALASPARGKEHLSPKMKVKATVLVAPSFVSDSLRPRGP